MTRYTLEFSLTSMVGILHFVVKLFNIIPLWFILILVW